ncbi:hypothetical protein MTO96_042368 [Rhipicephalus appendiculatus]
MDLGMEDEKPPPYVQYHCSDASVTLVEADHPPSREPPNKARGCRCSAMKSLGIAVTLCLITTVAALTLFFLQRAELLPKAEHLKTTDPNPPTNVTMIPESPLQSALRWGLPDKASGTIVSYIVNICRTFGSCDPAEKVSDCAEQTTTKMWTVFDSKADTSYCILIAARIRCGVDDITSRQVAAEVRTPLFARFRDDDILQCKS